MRVKHSGASSPPLLLLLIGLGASALAGCSDPQSDDDASDPGSSQAPQGDLSVSPSTVTFDDTQVGKTSTEDLTLTNLGAGPLTISAVQLQDDADGVFSLSSSSPDPVGALAGESSITITLELKPVKAGDLSAILRILSDDPDTPSLDVPLSGTATADPDGDKDQDEDGFTPNQGDCDDGDDTVYPGALELCDDQDNDCDGSTDENASGSDAPDGAPLWYADADGDGYGDNATSIQACLAPKDTVSQGGDCDDDDDAVYPGADEACDGKDNDCDDEVDEAGSTTFYADTDGDGHGDPDASMGSCDPDGGYVSTPDDCDDDDALTYLGADETCDDKDNDCDAQIDDDAVDASSYYADADGDGHGAGDSTTACEPPDGQVASSDDCDDAAATTYPGAPEKCDGADNDCDGTADEDAADAKTWYVDSDGDGSGGSSSLSACAQPTGYTASAGDCDDAASDVYPGADEVCDTRDNDCDGSIDENGQTTIYVDADGDSYGDSAQSQLGCAGGAGYSGRGGDCDDASASINPGAAEVCDGVDQDCDGTADDGVLITFYVDADKDGYGDDAQSSTGCSVPGVGYADVGGDCDDNAASVHPGASETCNSKDDDCDGTADDAAVDAKTWYGDSDGDGYGLKSDAKTACQAPSGYVADSSDCNDGDAAVHPGASETCNSIDDNCNGSIDEASIDASTWYLDADKDGYGGLVSTTACSAPSGYVSKGEDCNDSNPAINPGAAETCNNIDDDCDGTTDDGVTKSWYLDRDGDGYGDSTTTTDACNAPVGYVSKPDDCNDLDKAIYPGATEVCNSKDDDCDGIVDEATAADAKTWYVDSDKDGYGSASTSAKACLQPTGYVSTSTDCNDADAAVHPGATEVCNGKDDDCNGQSDESTASDAATWYLDADKDTYGSALVSQKSCAQPSGYVTSSSDCNDTDPRVNPGATEVCNGKDDDCNGQTDEASASDAKSWYQDNDKDNYGNPAKSQKACSQPVGYVADNTDCDDTDASSYPGASEKPTDAKDNDCDGRIDENGPLSSLAALAGHSVVYDPVRQRVLVFGGATFYDINSNVYALDLSGGSTESWEVLTPSGSGPPPLYRHVAVYDTLADRMIVFGGLTWYDMSDAVWSLSFGSSEAGTWSKLSPSGSSVPSARFGHAAIFDPVDDAMVVFGGQVPYDLSAEVWQLSLASSNGAWTLLNAGTSGTRPAARQGHGVAYDAGRDRMLLVGGDGYYERYADVWALDLAGFSWTALAPSGTPPPPVTRATVGFYASGKQLLVFGGDRYDDIGADLYALSFGSSPDGAWSTKSSSVSTPVPTALAGGYVVEADAVFTSVCGQTYYDLQSSPTSINLK